MLVKSTIAAFLLCTCAILGACATYKAGSPSAGTTDTIWIAPAKNHSYLPNMGTTLTQALRESMLRDNSFRPGTEQDSQLFLEITVTDLLRDGRARGASVMEKNKEGEVVSLEDRGIYKSYDIEVSAKATLRDASGNELFSGTFQANSQAVFSAYTTGGAEQERQLAPALARDLARQIHDAILREWEGQKK